MTTVYNITAEQILKHREDRKNSGMLGCITGRPVPEMDFFGYKDVQIWNTDANGHMNGDASFDRKNPGCFCFDCRGAFDPRAEVDTEIVNQGHLAACRVYASLLPKADMAALPNELRPPKIIIPPRTESYVCPPLPSPILRDVMNETKEVRLKRDLQELITDCHSNLVTVMDSRRQTITIEDPAERTAFLNKIEKNEASLWAKIEAANTLLSYL
jgi:hypothetical protein